MKKTIVREYRLQSPYIKEKQELTLAFLTDLHDQVTGEDGERFLQIFGSFRANVEESTKRENMQ